jgi:hypothetical protein
MIQQNMLEKQLLVGGLIMEVAHLLLEIILEK